MHPAYSVIFFTTLSGAGYGLLIWLAIARLGSAWTLDTSQALITAGVGLTLITAGLLSSSLHLGHPERAWRAFSQWRSSWLSREGVAAVLSYPPALLLAAGWLPDLLPPGLAPVAALATIATALLTVACTGMIYASLKTIPRWHNAWVVPVYLAFSASSGGLLFALALSGSGLAGPASLQIFLATLLAAWLIKWMYWRFIDAQSPLSDAGTATGLGRFGTVRQLEAPHTSENYLLNEMAYVIARKHARRLRRISLGLGMLLPALLLLAAMAFQSWTQIGLLSLALLSGFTGLAIERWLFFAQARHVVTLYYGRVLQDPA
jgi:DMSO reductase anchor subunit